MRIDIGNDYHLCSDQFQYWIEKRVVSQKTGKESYKTVTGYFQSLENLMGNFAAKEVRKCDAESVEALNKIVKTIRNDLLTFSENIGKQLDKLIENG